VLDQWNNFFVMVGGGAAALAGLIFVAMSINPESIIRNTTHKNRAINMLSGFSAIFMACSLALRASPGQALALSRAAGERLSGLSSCKGIFFSRLACFCVEADEEFACQRDPRHHLGLAGIDQLAMEVRQAFVEAAGDTCDQEQD